MRASWVRIRLGRARSSKKMSRNSSRERWNTKSSSPSPSLLALPWPRPPPPPEGGRLIRSPLANWSLPENTCSHMPPRPCWNCGSPRSFDGIVICSPLSRSRMERSWIASFTARRICCLKRRMKRCRFTALFFLLSNRRSMMRVMCLSGTGAERRPGLGSRTAHRSRGLADPQIPLAQQSHLLLRVPLLDHAIDEVLVLLLIVGTGLRVEADDGQELLGVREHLLLDHAAQFLVARPARVLAVVLGPGTQHEIHHLVAKILRVADAGRLLDLLQLVVQGRAVED